MKNNSANYCGNKLATANLFLTGIMYLFKGIPIIISVIPIIANGILKTVIILWINYREKTVDPLYGGVQ